MRVRRSPAERYIKYLILHPKKYTDDAIVRMLWDLQLDPIGAGYVAGLRKKLTPPQPFFPLNRRHIPSCKFVFLSGVSWLFYPDAETVKAQEILDKPRVKEFVESSLISHAPFNAITATLEKRHRFSCTETTITRYRTLFWDIDLLDSSELRVVLQMRVTDIKKHEDPAIKSQYDAAKNAFYTDSRKIAADLPFSPLTSLMSQIRMGVMPSKLDIAQILHQAKGVLAIRIAEAAFSDGKFSALKSMQFATALRSVSQVIEETVKPDDNLRSQIATISLRTIDTPLPTVHQLSNGAHTVDVVPIDAETTDELTADDALPEDDSEPTIEGG